MKNVLIYPLFLVLGLLSFSCSNSNDNAVSPVYNVFQTPVVTGLLITNMYSPEVIAVWGNPADAVQVNSNIYSISNKNHEKVSNSKLKELLKTNNIPGPYSFLYVPYPNPNDGATVIQFVLPEASKVSLWIVQARFVGDQNTDLSSSNGGVFISSSISPIRELYKNKTLNAGQYRVNWDGKDNNGNPVASGFFRVFFSAGKYSAFRDIFLYRSFNDVPPNLLKLIRPENP